MLQNFPLISQNDPKWRDQKLGSSKSTIGDYGCLITCVTAIMEYAGVKMTVAEVNEWLKNNNGYASGNLFVWAKFDQLSQNKVDYQNKYVRDGGLSSTSWDEINKLIAQNIPVMIEVDFKPNTDAPDMHWVVYLGDNKIMDAWNGKIEPITKYGDPAKKVRSYVKIAGDFKGGESMANVKELEKQLADLQAKESRFYQAFFNDGFRVLAKELFNEEYPEGSDQTEFAKKLVNRIQQKVAEQKLSIDRADTLLRNADTAYSELKTNYNTTVNALNTANEVIRTKNNEIDQLTKALTVLEAELAGERKNKKAGWLDIFPGAKTKIAAVGLILVAVADWVKLLPAEYTTLLMPALQGLGMLGIYMKLKRGEFDEILSNLRQLKK